MGMSFLLACSYKQPQKSHLISVMSSSTCRRITFVSPMPLACPEHPLLPLNHPHHRGSRDTSSKSADGSP